ncbi:lipoyl(octanoyl) transferase LipB [soil metagenome]
MQNVSFHDLELIDYKQCWDLQEALLAETLRQKLANRSLPENEQHPSRHFLIFCEHPHVFTLGKSGLPEHLLADENVLQRIQATYYKINRGGDITYHGPGQLVGYPIFDLDFFFNDIHKYLRLLEEAIILTCKDYGLETGRIPGLTGVWVDKDDAENARKICAFGVRCSRWVTMHGFAFNVNTDLDYFGYIVPCGIEDKGVTSLEKELGHSLDLEEVKIKVLLHLQELFQFGIASPDHELLPWPDRIKN